MPQVNNRLQKHDIVGTSFAHDVVLGSRLRIAPRGIVEIMVSIWWLLLAFVVGGYLGMLLLALLVILRSNNTNGSAVE